MVIIITSPLSGLQSRFNGSLMGISWASSSTLMGHIGKLYSDTAMKWWEQFLIEYQASIKSTRHNCEYSGCSINQARGIG